MDFFNIGAGFLGALALGVGIGFLVWRLRRLDRPMPPSSTQREAEETSEALKRK